MLFNAPERSVGHFSNVRITLDSFWYTKFFDKALLLFNLSYNVHRNVICRPKILMSIIFFCTQVYLHQQINLLMSDLDEQSLQTWSTVYTSVSNSAY